MGNRAYGAQSTGGSATEVHDYVRALNNQQKSGAYQFLERLNPGGKVVKTCTCRHKRYGKMTLAVYPKPVNVPSAEKDQKIQPILKQLEGINDRLNLLTHPGVISHRLIHESKEALYFARQYFAFNVFERFHVRPFFSNVDKHWIAYQLLQATQQLHASGIHHGGIKSENIMITTWNWLFVTDIAFYKPAYLPADNPSTYNYFFDAEKQRTTQPCYIAPERFYDSKVGAPLDHKLTDTMDIFSVGCCLAEIFLEGSVIFDYSQMLRYRTGDYSPLETLNKIKNPHVRRLIEHMIQLDPRDRLTAKQYLGIDRSEGKIAESIAAVFPSYLRELYNLFTKLLDPSLADPDSKIKYLHEHLDQALIELVIGSSRPGDATGEGAASRRPGRKETFVPSRTTVSTPTSNVRREVRRRGEAATARSKSPNDDRGGNGDLCAGVIRDMTVFIEGLGRPAETAAAGDEGKNTATPPRNPLGATSIPQTETEAPTATPEAAGEARKRGAAGGGGGGAGAGDLNGLAIIVSVVGACIQSLASPSNRVKALAILEKVTRHSRGPVVLDLVIPIAVYLRTDPHGIVRCKVVELLAFALERINSIGFVDLNVLNDFIMPIIMKLHPDHEKDPMVQISVCNLIPSFMQAARRFLDMAHRLKDRGGTTSNTLEETASYDKDLQAIKNNFLSLVVGFLAMGCSKAKIVLLNNLLPVCEFLGRNLVVEKEMMMHLTTILNEQDWELRAAMFKNLPQSSQYLGHSSSIVADSLLPIMTEALYDSELFVSLEALKALKYLCCVVNKTESAPENQMHGGRRRTQREVVEKVVPLLLHPAAFIQKEACSFISALADVLGPAQSYVLIHPILSKYTLHTVMIITHEALLEGLRPPIPRDQYDRAVSMYLKAPRGSAKMLLQLQYFIRLDTRLVSDLHAYFIEVIKKSGPRRTTTSPVRQTPQTLVQSPGRNAVLYCAPTEPLAFAGLVEKAKFSESKDTKSRKEKASKSSGGEGSGAPACDPPRASFDVVQSAFEIPAADDNAGRIRDTKAMSSSSMGSSVSIATQATGSSATYPLTDWFVRGVRMSPADDEKAKPEVANASWRPKGILVAELKHRDAVNQLDVSEDSAFLASASNDGTLMVWNVSKLARVKDSFTLNPDIEYRCREGPGDDSVVGVAICEGTRRVAGVTTNGSIYVFTVDAGQDMRLTHEMRLETKIHGMATTVTHADTLSKSLLLYGTHLGTVHTWDFRRRKEPFVLDLGEFTHESGTNSFGVITASTIGPEGYTFFVGTSQGFVILWDLRYQLATSIWRHSSRAPVSTITVASGDAIPLRAQTNTKAPIIVVSVQGIDEVSAFCILTGVCRGVFKVLGSSNNLIGKSGAWTKVRRSPRMSVASKSKSLNWSTQLKRKSIVNPLSLPALRVYDLKKAGINEKFKSDFVANKEKFVKETRGINAFLLHERRSLITAGRDRIVRFWHLKDTSHSRRITREFLGPYNTKYSMRVENTTPIYEEQLVRQLYASEPEFSHKLRVPKGATAPSKIHEDQITDLKALRFPVEMLVSSDAQGIIKVWR